MTTSLLESTTEIKRALGATCALFTSFSGIPKERQQTATLRSRLLKKYPNRCASCGSPFSSLDSSAQAAHILALEEGGATTEANLVLLCEPCHKLYDSGRACDSRDTRGGGPMAPRWFCEPLGENDGP